MSFIIILPSVLSSTCNWENYGANSRISFYQNGCNAYITDNISISAQNDILSAYSPLIDDLNNDGINEIIISQAGTNEINIFNGADFDLTYTYFNPNITVYGQMFITDFISSTPENELILISQYNATDYHFLVMNYNGINMTITIDIDTGNIQPNGLNCYNIDSDSDIECLYFGTNGNLYAYDSTNNFLTSPIYSGGSNSDCLEQSIPRFYDYDENGNIDILSIWGGACNKILKLDGNGLGTFSYNYNFTPSKTTGQITGFAMADLNGGQKELVVVNSHAYYSVADSTSSYSYLFMYNIITNTEKCWYDLKVTAKNSPYIAGLRTCYNDNIGLDCDYNLDDYNDLWLIPFTYANVGQQARYKIFNGESALGECVNIGDIQLENATTMANYFIFANSGSESGWIKGVWGNMNNDSDYEFSFRGNNWDKDGNLLISLRNLTLSNYYMSDNTGYTVLGDVTGDDYFDFVIQTQYYEYPQRTKVYSIGYTNNKINVDFNTLTVDTGNPICLNSIVTYSVDFTDIENNYARMILDCYGNGSLSNGSFYFPNMQNSCEYTESGNFNTIMYFQDIYNLNDYSINFTYPVTVTESEFCNQAGEQGGIIGESEVGVSGGVQDWSSKIPSWLNDWGFKSTASKIFFGICIIIALIMGANYEFKNAFVSVIIGILGMIGLTYIGIFPIWLVFLIFLFTAILVFLVIFKFSSGESS